MAVLAGPHVQAWLDAVAGGPANASRLWLVSFRDQEILMRNVHLLLTLLRLSSAYVTLSKEVVKRGD